jgi:hypothetical protein
MNRPTRVRVGPYFWTIRWSRKDVMRHAPTGDACGVCDLPSMTIAIDPGPAEDYGRATLLHEILHACVRASDPTLDDDHEETAVAAMTGPLLAFLRDNPDALEYLTETK